MAKDHLIAFDGKCIAYGYVVFICVKFVISGSAEALKVEKIVKRTKKSILKFFIKMMG